MNNTAVGARYAVLIHGRYHTKCKRRQISLQKVAFHDAKDGLLSSKRAPFTKPLIFSTLQSGCQHADRLALLWRKLCLTASQKGEKSPDGRLIARSLSAGNPYVIILLHVHSCNPYGRRALSLYIRNASTTVRH